MKDPTSVLVIARSRFASLPLEGVWPLAKGQEAIVHDWMLRDDAEVDESQLQLIPYALIRRPGQPLLWTYQRTGGDGRVLGRHSCGVGGHLEPVDDHTGTGHYLDIAAAGLMREMQEEIGWSPEAVPVPVAWLYEGRSFIGRTHIGLIYIMDWPTDSADPESLPGEPMRSAGFMPADAIAGSEDFELWSRLAAAAFAANECHHAGYPSTALTHSRKNVTA